MKVRNISLNAMLIALGIIIPLVMPLKLVIPPASYTFASHVPVFIAMFISPLSAVIVSIGVAIGFLMSAPIIIAIRAASHLVFALLGAIYIQKHRDMLKSAKQQWLFNIVIGLIHAGVEVLVVLPFYFGGSLPEANYASGFWVSMVLLLGVGGFIHSLLDYVIAVSLARSLKIVDGGIAV